MSESTTESQSFFAKCRADRYFQVLLIIIIGAEVALGIYGSLTMTDVSIHAMKDIVLFAGFFFAIRLTWKAKTTSLRLIKTFAIVAFVSFGVVIATIEATFATASYFGRDEWVYRHWGSGHVYAPTDAEQAIRAQIYVPFVIAGWICLGSTVGTIALIFLRAVRGNS